MKFEERYRAATRAATRVESPRRARGSAPVVPADDIDAAKERRPLESYFQEIGGTRTLKREEEVILAKDLEAATVRLREALYAVPCSARHVVARWDGLRALSHTGAKLSESAGDEETGEVATRVERSVQRLRRRLRRREALLEEGGSLCEPGPPLGLDGLERESREKDARKDECEDEDERDPQRSRLPGSRDTIDASCWPT